LLLGFIFYCLGEFYKLRLQGKFILFSEIVNEKNNKDCAKSEKYLNRAAKFEISRNFYVK